MNRRSFILTAGGAAAGFGAANALPITLPGPPSRAGDPAPRVVVLSEPGFPADGGLSLPPGSLRAALSDFPAVFAPAADLPGALASSPGTPPGRLLVNPHGGNFPVEAWPALRRFLADGGSLLNLGGIPFSRPVRREGTAWVGETRQTVFHRELGITAAFPVGRPEGAVVRDLPAHRDALQVAAGLTLQGAWALYYRFTSTKDFPGEDGSSGQRDATVTPLTGLFDGAGRMTAAPVVMIDRVLGEYAGGRWVLANFDGGISPEAVTRLAWIACGSPVTASVAPTFASYLPGETPAFRLESRDPRATSGGRREERWSVEVSDDRGSVIARTEFPAGDGPDGPGRTWVLPADAARRLKPGLHTVSAGLRRRDGTTGRTERLSCGSGFWIRDDRLLASIAPLAVRGGAFHRDGRPFPITGTSFMSGGVQRKFLLEPDPAGWDRDFAAMRAAGINLVRTGIWTGWKNLMLDAGVVAEHPLRSIEAFLQTAARHDLPVIFTLFAFLPEAWGGGNPYLDPRAVRAQSLFAGAIASRFRGAGGVAWDLINEPSFSSPDHLWQCRPNYDGHEREAWSGWLRERVGNPDQVRERLRLRPGDAGALPSLDDFRETHLTAGRTPLRAGEYRLFAQEMFRRWAAGLAAVVRREGGGGQLVTVGQDEGGTYERPGPHFFRNEVDFTSVHTWWFNDDLLWDTILTTVPGKPNLAEETGIMFAETPDGLPWRTEEEARDLLERKLAISFTGGSGGFVNWLWNANPYMDSDNEAAIGLRRADGSAKPELAVLSSYGRFFSRHAGLLEERIPEETVLVIPHSSMFSTRNHATEATRTAVRAMEYHRRIPLRSVSEYSLDALTAPPRLLLLPSPGQIDGEAWSRLMALVGEGSTLLVTGPIDEDRHLIPAGRSAGFGIAGGTVPVGAEEHLLIGGREHRLGFRGEKMQRARKFAAKPGAPSEVFVLPRGRGRVLWAQLPVELSDSIEATAALYRMAADAAGVAPPLSGVTDDPSVLVRTTLFRETLLVAFVSEASVPRRITGTIAGSGAPFERIVPPRRTVVRFHRRSDGTLLAELDPSAES